MEHIKKIGVLILLLGAVWATSFFTKSFGGLLFLGVVGGMIGGFVFLGFKNYQEQQNAIGLLMKDCDPEAFLNAFEPILERAKPGPTRDSLLLNKAAGLCYAGRIEEGLQIIRQVDGQFLEGIHRILYENNRFAIYIMAGRKTEMRKVWKESKEMLQTPVTHPELAAAISGCIGAMYYLEGDYPAAKAALESISEAGIPRLMLAVKHYYLGMVLLRMEDESTGKQMLLSADKLGGKTIYSQWANEELSKLKN